MDDVTTVASVCPVEGAADGGAKGGTEKIRQSGRRASRRARNRWALVLPNLSGDENTGDAGFSAIVGAWRVSGQLKAVDGQLVISFLQFEPALDLPPSGITSSTLRAFPIGKLMSKALSDLVAAPEWIKRNRLPGGTALFNAEDIAWREAQGLPATAEDFERLAKAAAARATPVHLKRGPKGYPDEHYRRIALLYLELQGRGWGRGILDEIARKEGRPRETIRDWVHQARKREFLTKGQPGRAGAKPGPRLYQDEENG